MSTVTVPDQKIHRNRYEQYLSVRRLVAKDIEEAIEETLRPLPSRPMVKGRVKEFESYYEKYLRVLKQHPHTEPAAVTDLIGLRVICPFFSDLAEVQGLLKNRFDVIEVELKGSDYSFKEFGYESVHLLIKIPPDISALHGDCGLEIAEIQIRTILQDAWAEVEHALVYKSSFASLDDLLNLNVLMKRKLAAVNASLVLADTIFNEIRTFQQNLNGELRKRQDSFLKKTEETLHTPELVGSLALKQTLEANPADTADIDSGATIDELVLKALSAHNKNQFQEAIDCYTRILKKPLPNGTAATIYKHRGMAHFARSHYEEACADFTKALTFDPASHKAAYYRGVVKSVLQQYTEAVDDFTLSLSINPYYGFCFYRRGQAYYHLEDLPKALGDCEAGLSLEPELPELQRFKELLLKKLKM